MMIDRYLLRLLAGGAAVIVLSLAIAIWLTQSLRFLDLAVNGGAPVSAFLNLVFLTLPNFLLVILPIAAFIVILWGYNKLMVDSEAVVLQAVGMGPWRLARPALILALIVSLIVLSLGVWLAPVAQREMKELRQVMRSQYSAVLVREGVFSTLDGGTTVYIRDRTPSGELRGILIHEQGPPGTPTVTVVAKRGALIQGESGPRALVFDGSRQELQSETGRLTRLDFERYAFDLQVFEPQIGVRWREPAERTLWELFQPTDDPEDQANAVAFRVEAHSRLGNALLPLALALIAIPSLLAGEFSRRGQGKRILIAIAGATLVQAGALGAPSLAVREPMLIPLIYVVPLIAILGGCAVLFASRHRAVSAPA